MDAAWTSVHLLVSAFIRVKWRSPALSGVCGCRLSLRSWGVWCRSACLEVDDGPRGARLGACGLGLRSICRPCHPARVVWVWCRGCLSDCCAGAGLRPGDVLGVDDGLGEVWIEGVRSRARVLGSPRPRWRAAPDSAPVPALGRAASAAAPQALTLSLRVLECVSRVSWGVCWCALRRHPPGSRVLRALGRTGLGPAVPRPVGRVPRALGRARPVPSTACRTPICPRMPWGALVMYLPFSRVRPGTRSSATPGPGLISS